MCQGLFACRQVEVLVVMAAAFGRTLVLPGHLDEPRAADAPGAGFADVWDWKALRSWNPVCSMQQYRNGRCAVFSKQGNAMSVWLAHFRQIPVCSAQEYLYASRKHAS